MSIRNMKAILDTSVVIALLKNEKGFEKVAELMASAAISTVNYSEVVSVLVRNNISAQEVDEIMVDLVPIIIPFTEEIGALAGKLILNTQSLGLSLGDRACLATGIIHNLPIYTADKAWADLKVEKADVRVIR